MKSFLKYIGIVIVFSVAYGLVDYYLDDPLKYKPFIAVALILGFLYPCGFPLSWIALVMGQYRMNITLHYCYHEPQPGDLEKLLENNTLYANATCITTLVAGAAGALLGIALRFVKRRWRVR